MTQKLRIYSEILQYSTFIITFHKTPPRTFFHTTFPVNRMFRAILTAPYGHVASLAIIGGLREWSGSNATSRALFISFYQLSLSAQTLIKQGPGC